MLQLKKPSELSAPTVFVVDPDPTTGGIVRELLGASNLACEIYHSARDFLSAYRETRLGCVVLEQRIPDMSGLQLQHRLAAAGIAIPLVFVMANPNVSTAVEIMRGGAVHLLEKPIRPIELLTAVQEALDLDGDRRRVKNHQTNIDKLTEGLSHKELQVLRLIAQGKSPKVIAAELHRSVRAIELRRKNLMKKLHVRSALELMRFSVIGNCLPPTRKILDASLTC